MVVRWRAEAALPIAQAPVYKACAMVRRGRRQWRRPEGAPPQRGGTSPTYSPAHCTRRSEEADALHRGNEALRRLTRRQAIDRQSACTSVNGAISDVAQQGNAAPRGAHWRLYGPTKRCTRPPLPSTTTATPPERLLARTHPLSTASTTAPTLTAEGCKPMCHAHPRGSRRDAVPSAARRPHHAIT